jgi:hypothetical protein
MEEDGYRALPRDSHMLLAKPDNTLEADPGFVAVLAYRGARWSPH